MLAIIFSLLGAVGVVFFWWLFKISIFNPQLGKDSSLEERKNLYGKYPYFKDKIFKPFEVDMMLTVERFFEYMFGLLRKKESHPKTIIENIPFFSDVQSENEGKITWFGHSSLLLQLGSKNILIDPVFSGHASPVSFFAKQFPYRYAYDIKEFPAIDVLIISHNHYDHLDYETFCLLKDKVKWIVTSLGLKKCLEFWGADGSKIVELGWDESFKYEDLEITAVAAKHFSGRTFRGQNASFWSGWMFSWRGKKVYYSGDSGYDVHFKAIGEKYGPVDFAAVECGAYDKLWSDIHMFPEETVQVAKDLGAKVLLPVHWAKFDLALHPWHDPIERALKAAEEKEVQVTTPKIGQTINLDEIVKEPWWRD